MRSGQLTPTKGCFPRSLLFHRTTANGIQRPENPSRAELTALVNSYYIERDDA
jgi:hypothetical protein